MLASGITFGPYRILAPPGAGRMVAVGLERLLYEIEICNDRRGAPGRSRTPRAYCFLRHSGGPGAGAAAWVTADVALELPVCLEAAFPVPIGTPAEDTLLLSSDIPPAALPAAPAAREV